MNYTKKMMNGEKLTFTYINSLIEVKSETLDRFPECDKPIKNLNK